jgi:hypothetical protein
MLCLLNRWVQYIVAGGASQRPWKQGMGLWGGFASILPFLSFELVVSLMAFEFVGTAGQDALG